MVLVALGIRSCQKDIIKVLHQIYQPVYRWICSQAKPANVYVVKKKKRKSI